ncbi:MAG TPA: ABC transporter permease [Anaerolineales bacterium]|nr:ABC transporter permease [Anaerolineales bacterium]
MNELELVQILASIVLQAAPLMIAVAGETITERVGVVNLSLDGSMLMSAMTGFVIGYETDSVWLGFLAGAAVGAFFALIVAFGSIRLRQSQVAIGFVLTLLGDDLSAFLGQNYTRIPGPTVDYMPIPILKDIPILGPIFFDHDIVVYFAFALVFATWWWLFRTQPGLHLRGAGERPEAAFARGVNVNRVRYIYTLVGGALVGIAGAAYSLNIKVGWAEGHTRGLGWIALAIVIFGGWSPFRATFGALLFGATKALATVLQRAFPEVSVVAFNSIPWLLMIFVLLLVGSESSERLVAIMPKPLQRPLRRLLRAAPPMALGTRFGEE